jgi:uncharacterized protein (TIGR03067 family)
VSCEVNGKQEKSPKRFIIVGEKFTGLGPEMTVKLDVSKKPNWMDLTFKKGDQFFPIHAICEINGDELRICMPVAQRGVLFENDPKDSRQKESLSRFIKQNERITSSKKSLMISYNNVFGASG